MVDDTIDLATETIFLNSCHLLGISILFWDHLITLDKEITYLWVRKKSSSSLWFFAVRYIGLGGNIPVLLFSFMTLSPTVCTQYSFLHQIVLVATQFLVSVIMLLRTWALYGRDKRVLGSLVALGACLLAVCSWAVQGQKAIPVAIYPGCHLGVSEISGYHLSATWAALFLYDSIVFGMTLFKTYSTRRQLGSGNNLPIHRLIVRDGALYFAAMALANLANIVTYYSTGPLLRGSLGTFANCISITMMSRLMLNLHEQANVGILTQMDQLRFEESIPLDFREPSEYLPATEPEPEPDPGSSNSISVVRRSFNV
ncbi:hypothetical protein FB451DRAFT_1226075 [Mycena latifolia]|nr:hypothetical protein FB451DRAFT_1226075 [Mycena latifolia]